MADFGLTDFGQNRLWPKPTLAKTDFGQNEFDFVCGVLCVMCCVWCGVVWCGVVWCVCGVVCGEACGAAWVLVSRFHGVGFHVWVLVSRFWFGHVHI